MFPFSAYIKVSGIRSHGYVSSCGGFMATIISLRTPTRRGKLMSLILDVFAVLWGITGMTLCQISDYSLRLIQGPLPAQSINANCD